MCGALFVPGAVSLCPELSFQLSTDVPSDFGPVVALECGGDGRESSRSRRGAAGTGDLLGRAVRPALDLDAAHDGEAADDDAWRARDDRHVAQPQAAATHEREAAEIDVEALRHDDVDAAPEGEGGDLDLGTLDLRPSQVHVAAAHDGDGIGLAADAPTAAGRVPAHDGDVPTAGLAWRERRCSRRGGSGAGRRQVGHDGIELAAGLGLEGGAHALGEFVERQAALDDVLAQQGDGAIAVRVRHALGEAAAGSGGGQVRDLGNGTFRHRRQSAPFARPGRI